MRRVLSAVLTGCASTALMWLALSQVEQVDAALRPLIAGVVGLVALVGAILLLPRGPEGVSMGSRNRFRKKGRVVVEESSGDQTAGSRIDVGSKNRMREGEVIVRGVDIGKSTERDA